MPYAPSVICCSTCNTHKPLEAFYGESNICKSCTLKYQKHWREGQKVKKLIEEVLALN